MKNQKELNILLEAVEILKNECLPKKGDTMKILKYENKTIKPRPNGKGYYVRYRDANGQHSIYGATAEETLQKLKNVLKTAPKKQRKNSMVLTLGKWWFKWLEMFKQDIRPGTERTYKTIYNVYIKQIENLELSNLTVYNMSEFLKNIKSSRQRVRTFNYLKACLEKAQKLKLIEINPFEILPRPKHEKRHVEALTKSEQEALIKTLSESNSKHADVFLFMLQQGVRVGEALGLTIDNIDYVNKTITINKTYSHYILGETKTPNSRRTLPMFGSVYEILLKYAGTKPGERMFKYSERYLNAKFQEFAVLAGISKHVTTHSLRSTFATRLYEAGIPSLQIRDWLGHSDVATTEQIYIKVLKESSLKWVNIANLMLKTDTQTYTQNAISL